MLRLLQPAWLSAWLISLISGVGGAEIPLTSLNDSKVRAWIITAEYEHAIHRFFDSSPISPSNQFLATTTLPSFAASASASPLTTSYKQASIQVTDITSGATTLVDLTDAWDSQLGAQVQWGATDSELYYNVLQNVGANVPADASTPHPHQSNGCSVVRGVRLNMLTRQKTLLQCPVYHVSNDGKLAAAPNLLKIHHTQKGYGVRVLDTTAQKEHVRGAAHGDGLYITNTVTVRTMEQPVAPRKGLVRVQHLFVVSASGTTVRRMVSWASYPFVPARCHSAENVDSNNNGRVNSSSSTSASKCSPVHLRDGNHPNWVPHAHRISMNLQKYKPKGQPQPSTAEDVLSSVSRLVNLQPTVRESEWNIVSFDVEAHADNFIFHDHHPVRVVCDFTRRNHTHQCLLRESSTRQNTASAESELPHGLGSERQLLINVDHDKGSGHPIYHPSGKYIVTDAYLKEAQVLHKQGSAAHNGDTVPLRLIEIATQREVQLLQMHVQRTTEAQGLLSQAQHHLHHAISYISSALAGVDQSDNGAATTFRAFDVGTGTNNSSNNSTASTCSDVSEGMSGPATTTSPISPPMLVEDKSWRCDLHPAWSRDFQWVAINGRPRGRERQVVLLHLGPDLGALFP